MFGAGQATTLFETSDFDRAFDASVLGSRVLSRLSSSIELPDRVELATDRPMIIAANHSSLFDLSLIHI